MKFNRDKIYQRLIKETKGKNTYTKNLIHDRHLSSLGLSINDVKEVDSKFGVSHLPVPNLKVIVCPYCQINAIKHLLA